MNAGIRHALFLASATAVLALAAAPAAHARGEVYFSIGVQPAPVYVQPAPVYVQPRPVYVQPQPVYVQPATPYYRYDGYRESRYADYGWERRRWHAHRYGPYGDLDRDGIQNRDDRDRDGDGVRNRHDRAPSDPYHY